MPMVKSTMTRFKMLFFAVDVSFWPSKVFLRACGPLLRVHLVAHLNLGRMRWPSAGRPVKDAKSYFVARFI